jgi:glutamate racemase
MPNEALIYFGDQAHVPYGARSLEQVLEFSISITEFLISLGAKMIVVACNTASAAALKKLRIRFPAIQFVGMEPAIKPAVEHSISGAVGVLATPATFQSELYASVIERFAQGVNIYQDTCSGLVQEIEKGHFEGRKTKEILEKALHPMLANKIDAVVLGCTHYPFVIPLIQSIVGPEVQVIDPSPAVARQVKKIFNLLDHDLISNLNRSTEIFSSGNILQLKKVIAKFYPFTNTLHQAFWVEKDQELKVTQ